MNEVSYISVKQSDGYTTKVTYFSTPKKPKASILILHGMAEHQSRYYSYAKYLTEQEFDVFLYDHRGHGTDKKLSDLGYFATEKGYQLVIDDVISVSEYIEKNNRCKKFFLVGHSMGSLIARNVIQINDRYSGVILSGTAHPSKLLSASGTFIASLIKKFKGPKHISPFLNNLLFGNKKYTSFSDRTAYDWLSRSHPVVGAYVHDPFCGFTCTASFYHDLIRLTANASKKKLILKSKKELPLFIISGEKDPVGGFSKEVKKYVATLKKLGFNNVTCKLYPESRHELLNELNNQEVYEDIYAWMIKRI